MQASPLVGLVLSHLAPCRTYNEEGAVEQPPKTIRYHYIKSNSFRIVHADGVYGGSTPKGYLHLDFFSERFPIPQLVEHSVNKRIMSIPIEQLRDVPLRVISAGGIEKVEAIFGAIKLIDCNVLITNEDTAKALLKYQH